MRKGCYGLCGIVCNDMKRDVLAGDVFVFINKRCNKLKLLQWDRGGFALYEGWKSENRQQLNRKQYKTRSTRKKNYLFAGSHDAAQRGVMLYSLFATFRLHNLDPEAWLTDVLRKINDTKINCIKELLPQNYIKR